MDEPTVGIDPQSRNYILQSVKKLNEMGCTIIYTSHYNDGDARAYFFNFLHVVARVDDRAAHFIELFH